MESYQVFRWCRGDFEGREHEFSGARHMQREKTRQTDAANDHDDALLCDVSTACAKVHTSLPTTLLIPVSIASTPPVEAEQHGEKKSRSLEGTAGVVRAIDPSFAG